VVLPVLTPRWKLSEWTRYETYGALAVIPVLFEGTLEETLTPPLGRFQAQFVHLAGATPSDWARLIEAIRFQLDKTREPHARLTHLRFPPNPCFVGREAVLNEIHEKLFLNPTTALTQGHIFRRLPPWVVWAKQRLRANTRRSSGAVIRSDCGSPA
jgi:hypothetical protein